MLVRNNQVGDPSKFYNDAMMQKPSVSDTVFDNLASGFATPTVALNMVDNDFSKKPDGKAILSSLENIRLAQENPNLGWGQWLAGEGANMVGMALNPITWGLGAIGEGAGAGIIKGTSKLASKALPDATSVFMRKPLKELLAEPVAKYLPSQVGKAGAEKDLSLALLSEKSLTTFGTFAGAGVPQGVVDNFNQDTNHIGWGGVAREAGEMGAFGIVIGSIPFTWGVLRGKINRASGRGVNDVVGIRDVDSAFEKGRITKDEHAWYVDYLEHQKNPSDVGKLESLQSRATEIAGNNGHKTNAVSNEALFDILTPEDISNLHGVVADQLASAHLPEEQRKALSNFIVHNRLDQLRSNPESLDGVRGYVDFINQKMANKEAKLAQANEILDKHLLTSMKDNMILSQKELFKMIRKSGFEASHVHHLPVTLPENLKSHLKVVEKITKLKSKLKQEERRNKTKTLYRGEYPEYPGQVVQYQMLNDDSEFGKGYWFAESREHAKHYGHEIEELKSNHKLYDVVTGKDHQLNVLYRKIKQLIKDGYLGVELIVAKNKLRDLANKKGYEGLIRREGWADKYGLRTRVNGIAKAKKEIMFFERPKSSTKEFQPNKQTVKRIEELESKLPKLLTPKEELAHIRKTLLSEKGLPKKWQNSVAYHRLLDLSHVWENAKTLLDRVHMEDEYNRQEAFKNVSESILKISDSDQTAFAKPENVVDYLKARIEGQLHTEIPMKDIEMEVAEQQKVPTDADQVVDEQAQMLKDTLADDAKKELEVSTRRYKEFKSSENVFKNLISCVLGGLGG